MLWIDDPKCINSSAPAAEQGGLPDFTGKYHFLFFQQEVVFVRLSIAFADRPFCALNPTQRTG
jgi:hypothetical protein